MASVTPIAIIVALIVMNGVFVAAEFAIVGAPRAAIHRGAARGGLVARLVQHILRDPRRQDRFIATAQLGITAASLALGMYGEHVMATWIAGHLETWGVARWVAAHGAASVIAVTVLTYFHIVLGEMVPKSLALQRAHDTVLWIAPFVTAVQIVAYPLVIALNGLGNGILSLFGVDRRQASPERFRTPEELAYVVRESQSGGLLREETANVVSRLLQFADLTAGEVMVPRVRMVGIALEASVSRVRSVLVEHPHTRYPVYQGTADDVVGMVHAKDLLRWLPTGAGLSARVVRPVPFLPETARMEHVLSAMRQARSQMVIVMDEHGGTAGLITTEDLFGEVAGDLAESAQRANALYRDAAGRCHVVGTVRLDEAGAELGIVLAHDEVDTVSGLVLALLGRPPVTGDVVMYRRAHFEVTKVDGHGVGECVVSVLPAAPPARPV